VSSTPAPTKDSRSAALATATVVLGDGDLGGLRRLGQCQWLGNALEEHGQGTWLLVRDVSFGVSQV
jgi:hypothetical protein